MLQRGTPQDFVIGTGETHSVREFCELAFSHVGLDYEEYVIQDPRFYRPAEVDLLVADPGEADEELGWQPKIGFMDIQGWSSFFVVLLLAGGIMLGGWVAVKADKSFELPRWLGWLIIGAAVVRLLAGVIWYTGLPNWGYGSPVEQAGYIMADAHLRDISAWELSQAGPFLGWDQVKFP